MASDRDPLGERLALVRALDRGASVGATSRPSSSRAAMLATALAGRPATLPAAAPGSAAGLLVEVSDALDADLATLDEPLWLTPVIFDWSVQDTVAHLSAVHEVLCARLNGTDVGAVTSDELDAATNRLLTISRREAPEVTRERFRAAVCRLRHGLEVCDTEINWLGLVAPAETIIVDRAFETWVHANDIRRATNRASLDPSGEHLKVLCDLAIELLPMALIVSGYHHDAVVAVNLSGPGGGSWVMPLGIGAASGREFTFNASARELCLLMGNRIDPADFAFTVRGPYVDAAAIARDLVDTAPVFARA